MRPTSQNHIAEYTTSLMHREFAASTRCCDLSSAIPIVKSLVRSRSLWLTILGLRELSLALLFAIAKRRTNSPRSNLKVLTSPAL